MVDQKELRLQQINDLIKLIGNTGRRFFYRKGKYSRMEMKNGRYYFIDKYTGEAIYCYGHNYFSGKFTDGGTNEALVRDFREFIKTGKPTNGMHGYGGLLCPHWGYPDEDMEKIRSRAKEIGFLRS